MSKRHRNDGLRKVCDCSRRVWAKCPHPWHLNYKWNGNVYRFSLDREVGHRFKSKADAKAEAERIRLAIRAGTFRSRLETPAPATLDTLTVSAFGNLYVERVSKGARVGWRNDAGMFRTVAGFPITDYPGIATLGEKPLTALTEDDLETFLSDLKAKGRAASTRNHFVQLFKASLRWATRKGYLPRNPITDTDTIKREKFARRTRRLQDGEEAALLAAAGPHLQRVIVGALETGCRCGELLSLQWREVDLERRELRILAAKAKDRESRVLPISTRLGAVLEMARLDPAGQVLGPDASVFGNPIGRPVLSIRTAWERCVLKAHGVTPAIGKGRGRDLTPACKAAYQTINLHVHDLRHEAGSRFLEAGMKLHYVQAMLGHSDIKTTSTYLNVRLPDLHEAMRQVEENRPRCKPVAHEAPSDLQPPCNEDRELGGKGLVH